MMAAQQSAGAMLRRALSHAAEGGLCVQQDVYFQK